MGIVLALLSALCFGSSDFAAGVGGRRSDPSAVTAIAQPFGLIAAAVAVIALSARSPTAHALWWGALSGIGSGVGTVSLYRGLAVARMSVVAPLSAVLSAALPALAGLLLGEHLAALAWAGIAIAMPAVALVSLQPGDGHGSRRAGIVTGVVAGAGFALLFIALDRAGTSAGAWPLVPGQAVAAVMVLVWAAPARNRPSRKAWSQAWRIGVAAGVLSGIANLLYLAATGAGQLAVVAVVTALYPAVTVLLARLTLHERWSRLQIIGLSAAAAAVAAISIG
ncbi:MAG: DMT family transporter [Streptosporangiaceae bacterium]|nr:DMT family transporter [Streptosporangiaceae bacterium]